MHRCAILDDYQSVALSMADWTVLGPEVEIVAFNRHFDDRAALVAALAEFDIIVAMRERTVFDADLFERLPRLNLLVTTGMRTASIDVAAAERRGVVLCGTGSVLGSTAQHTWALILALVRNIPEEVEEFRGGGDWQRRMSVDLTGKRLGLIGLGRLGTRVARVGVDFEMEVAAWSPRLSDERAAEVGAVRVATLNELLRTSDIVSVHVPLNVHTRGLIGAQQLRMMKRTAYLVNTSRGPIVNEAALLDALDNEWIAGAGVDVFDVEPLPPDHPYRRRARLIATPHIGYVTDATYRVYYGDAVADIAAWLKGEPLRRITV